MRYANKKEYSNLLVLQQPIFSIILRIHPHGARIHAWLALLDELVHMLLLEDEGQ